MPDIAALVTPPLLLDSTGAPANGDIFSRVTSSITIGTGLVTPTQAHGSVIAGQFKALDGTAFNLPVTPEGVAVELYVELREDRPSGSGQARAKHVIRRTVSVPDQSTVTWDELVDVVPVGSDTDYTVPAWVTQLLIDAADAAAPAIAARDEAVVAQIAAETAKTDAEAAVAGVPAAVAAGVAPKLDKTEAATTYDKPHRNTAILFGTSLEHQNQGGTDTLNPTAPDIPVNGRGWFHWANAFVGGHLSLVRNAGVPGNTYAQMLARIDADVLAYQSDWIFMGGPVNDISQNAGRPAVDIIADATAILNKLVGRRIVMLTAAPSTSYDTLSKRQALSAVNAWICDLPKTRPNIIVVDAWRVLVDPATGGPATGMTNDGIVHYSQAAAARIGKVVADAIRPHVVSSPPKVSYANDPRSAIANPNFLTSGAGWAATAAVTAAYPADENTFGNKAVLTIAANAATGDIGITSTELFTAGRFAVGDVIQVSARVKWSNIVPLGVVTRIQPLVRCRQFDNNNAFLTDSQAIALYDSDNNRVIPNGFPTSGEVVVRTHKVTVQNPGAGLKSIQVLLGFAGIASGTVEISDLNVAKV